MVSIKAIKAIQVIFAFLGVSERLWTTDNSENAEDLRDAKRWIVAAPTETR